AGLAGADGPARPLSEASIVARNGSRRWIQWTSVPLRDELGRPAGFASIGEDVTEVRALRAAAARRECEQEFRTMADNAPLMIWETGPNGGCAFVNRDWRSFTGCPLEKQLGTGWLSILHPDDRKPYFDAYTAAFKARRSFQLEARFRR